MSPKNQVGVTSLYFRPALGNLIELAGRIQKLEIRRRPRKIWAIYCSFCQILLTVAEI